MNNLDISKIGYRWKGEYSPGGSYAKGDVVRVGTKTQVFTDDNGNKRDFAVGENQFSAKNQIALDSNDTYPTGYSGMNLKSSAGNKPEFKHGNERDGGRAVKLAKSRTGDVEYVSAYHLGAIMTDGSLRLWGDQTDSTQGTGTNDHNRMLPSKACLPPQFQYPVKNAWLSYGHTYVVDSNNVLYMAGRQFGFGGADQSTSLGETTIFRQVSHDDQDEIQEEIVDVSSAYGWYGYYPALLLGASGKVYSVGAARHWAFGQPDNNNHRSPRLIPFTADHPMSKIFMHPQNYQTSTLIDTEGKMWTAGYSSRNFLEYSTDSLGHQKYDPWGDDNARVVHVCKHESDGHWASGTQYYFHGAITLEDGRCYIIGNGNNQVGFGTASTDAGWTYGWDLQPQYPFHTGVKKLMSKNGGYGCAVAMMQDGTVEHRGYSIQSPTGNHTTEWTPFNSNTSGYLGPDITNAVDLQGLGARYGSSFAVRTSDGKMINWGYWQSGGNGVGSYAGIHGATSNQHGTGMNFVKCPENIVDFSLHGYMYDSTGNGAIHALDDKGQTWVWGWGNYAITQDDDNENIAVPIRVKY